jgi:hypothetical protein
MFCTENLKARNVDPDLDGKDAEPDIKMVHSMNGSVKGQVTSPGKYFFVLCEGQIIERRLRLSPLEQSAPCSNFF